MAQCQNCKANIGCGCNARRASDGKSCCQNCLANYEATLKKSARTTVNTTTTNTSPVVNGVTSRRIK